MKKALALAAILLASLTLTGCGEKPNNPTFNCVMDDSVHPEGPATAKSRVPLCLELEAADPEAFEEAYGIYVE